MKIKPTIYLFIYLFICLFIQQIALLQSKNDALAQKVDHKQGNIVQECFTRESAFATRVSELQVEVKHLKKSERTALRDSETLKHQLATLQKSYDTLGEERKQLGQDVKDRKLRESQFNDEYNLLEEENTYLQKAVSKLKHTLVEYEGLKVENKSLLDEVCFTVYLYFQKFCLKIMKIKCLSITLMLLFSGILKCDICSFYS